MEEHHESHARQATHGGEQRHAADTVVDPVCGMTVDPARAAGSHRHEGRDFYFCSEHCRARFAADPARYLDEQPAGGGTAYTCPMHPEVRQDRPGNCPKCGMALEPVEPVPAEAVEYTCPMHPEVVSDRPGNCPKCGMALEPRSVATTGGAPSWPT
jgi:Cu+-exporting ATPase